MAPTGFIDFEGFVWVMERVIADEAAAHWGATKLQAVYRGYRARHMTEIVGSAQVGVRMQVRGTALGGVGGEYVRGRGDEETAMRRGALSAGVAKH